MKRKLDVFGGDDEECQQPELKRHESSSSTAEKSETTTEIVERYWRRTQLAPRMTVMSALLPRTGAGSLLGTLDAHTLRCIVDRAIPRRRVMFCTVDAVRITVRDAGNEGCPAIVSCLHEMMETSGFIRISDMRVLVEWYALIQCRIASSRTGESEYRQTCLVDFRDPLHPQVRYLTRNVKQRLGFHVDKQAAVVGRKSFFLLDPFIYPSRLLSFVVSTRREEDIIREIEIQYNLTLELTEFGCDSAVLGNRERAWVIRSGDEKLRPSFSAKRMTLYGRGNVCIARIEQDTRTLLVYSPVNRLRRDIVFLPRYKLEDDINGTENAMSVGLAAVEVCDVSTGGKARSLSLTSLCPVLLGRASYTRLVDLGPWRIKRWTHWVFPDMIAVAAFRHDYHGCHCRILWITHDDEGGISVASTVRKLGYYGKNPTAIITGLDHSERCAVVCLMMDIDGATDDRRFTLLRCTADTKTGDVLTDWTTTKMVGNADIHGVDRAGYPIESRLNDRFT